ncbi:MAG: TonB-dependent receptor plug domain-containing protein, partial [Gammaproteobacteria bacterium]|nr:TonB-dependent receptor plug domain-containing protein [Gammaproteobacteria bacterium]
MPKKNWLPLALIALWCSSLPAAQDIETIIITASRIPQPLHTVGSSVTVIDLDDWRGTGATISDVLREVPGLTVSQQGGSGTLTALRMRGGESNHTRILLDGIELSDPTSGSVDFAHLSIAGIERIEILRGAPSALWGSDAISGIVNLISRKGGSS